MYDNGLGKRRQIFAIALIAAGVLGIATSKHHSSDLKSQPTAPVAVEPAAPVTPSGPPPKPLTDAELKRQEEQFHKEFEKKQERERIQYAKTMEEVLLLSGFSADVYASGPKHNHLTMKYIGVTKSLAFRFGQDQEKLMEMRNAGFTKFTMTDGYSDSWTWKLE